MRSYVLFFTAFTITLYSFGQEMVKGVVSDEFGALPLANIVIKHSEKGVFTDENGYFSIEAKPTDTLQVSYLGYKTKSVVVGKQQEIQITLNDYEELDTVVLEYYLLCRRTRCGMCYEVTYEYITEEDTIQPFKIYPNPSRDGLFTLTTNDASEVDVLVADLTGRVILNVPYKTLNSKVEVDLSNEPAGIYIIHISADGTVIASKKAIRI